MQNIRRYHFLWDSVSQLFKLEMWLIIWHVLRKRVEKRAWTYVQNVLRYLVFKVNNRVLIHAWNESWLNFQDGRCKNNFIFNALFYWLIFTHVVNETLGNIIHMQKFKNMKYVSLISIFWRDMCIWTSEFSCETFLNVLHKMCLMLTNWFSNRKYD